MSVERTMSEGRDREEQKRLWKGRLGTHERGRRLVIDKMKRKGLHARQIITWSEKKKTGNRNEL